MDVHKFCETTPDGVILLVRVQPRSKREGLQGLTSDGAALKWSVHAAPEDGKANEALRESLSQFFEIPIRSVSIHSGHSSRSKRVHLLGLGNDQVMSAILEAKS